MIRWLSIALIALLGIGSAAPACSICQANLQQAQSFRVDAAQAKLVLYGTLQNPNLVGTNGTTELHIEAVFKNDPFLNNAKVVVLPRYIPVSDPKDPPKFVVFCDVYNNKLDPYRGVPVKSDAVVEYLKGALALDGKDRTQALLYYFRYLENPEAEVAADAFLEFAKANDQEIGAVASKLAPEKLRGWVKDPKTPAYRLNVYSLMLGACGGEPDAALLRSLLQNPTEQTTNALDGILAGYIQLRPQEGWDLAVNLLRDTSKPFPMRYAILRTLRFYHGWKAEETRPKVLLGMGALLPEEDIADVAIEDLRRWQMWDLTTEVLAQYGKKSHSAPIMRRAILRYALCSAPVKPEAAAFVAERRRTEPALLKEVEDSLQFEKQK
jgi:hypothetical protein